MASVLDLICGEKRAEIAERRRRRPLAEVEKAALDRVEPPRGFHAALARAAATGYGLIAEIKKASPSKGVIREDFDPAGLARAYARGRSDLPFRPHPRASLPGSRRGPRHGPPCGRPPDPPQGLHARPLPGVRGPRDGRGLHPADHGRARRRHRARARGHRRRSRAGRARRGPQRGRARARARVFAAA